MKNEKWEQGSPTERHPFAIFASLCVKLIGWERHDEK
jgi:hypothetical protein